MMIKGERIGSLFLMWRSQVFRGKGTLVEPWTFRKRIKPFQAGARHRQKGDASRRSVWKERVLPQPAPRRKKENEATGFQNLAGPPEVPMEILVISLLPFALNTVLSSHLSLPHPGAWSCGGEQSKYQRGLKLF